MTYAPTDVIPARTLLRSSLEERALFARVSKDRRSHSSVILRGSPKKAPTSRDERNSVRAGNDGMVLCRAV
jgi:hypothetical protein